ncbi:MAG: dihydrolipoyl dehydrogenase [Clostridiales bacterium]|nr:dihydrolipoyl dehydrogenase [Clostridiales bacterium]
MVYDLVIIGAGPGGYEAALRAARLGLNTALVEKLDVGGTCLNRGCIPAKALLHAADMLNEIRESRAYGVDAGEPAFDIQAIYQKKAAVTQALRGHVETALETAGVALFRGTAKILAPGRTQVTGAAGAQTLASNRIIVACGARPARPPIPGLELERVVTSDELLAGLAQAPKTMVIMGGGVIGVELAEFFASLGCAVTILEGMGRLLPSLDQDLGLGLAQRFQQKGMAVITGAMVSGVQKTENGLRVRYERKGKPGEASGETVLCAIGRVPAPDGVFAPDLAPAMDRRRIAVNERYETSIPGIYAVGDVSAGIQLAHVAAAQGRSCVERIAGLEPAADERCVPSGIYCTPEISCVGLTAEQARANGVEAVSAKAIMTGNGRNVIQGGGRAFVKLVADAQSHRLIGAQLMCPRATDMISQYTQAIVNGLTVEQMLRAIRPHPTFDEGALEALYGLKRKVSRQEAAC